MKNPYSTAPHNLNKSPDDDLILQHLQKMLSSVEFYATKQQRKFLNFVVLETLQGKSSSLKGYTVATKVFGRGPDFNSSTDPIVSIQANRLRRALEHYYLVDGKQDPIRIDIPKGTYIPTFTERSTAEEPLQQTTEPEQRQTDTLSPSILVLPFANMTGDPAQEYLCVGIATELAIELSQFENIRVLFPRNDFSKEDGFHDTRFLLNGKLFTTPNGIQLTIDILDEKTNQTVWGNTFHSKINVEELYSFKEQVVRSVAVIISGEFGVIPRIISTESKSKPPSQLTSYEAMLRFWQYEQDLTAESFQRALVALSHAIQNESRCFQTTSSLALLYTTIHNLDIPGFDSPLDKALEYGERAAAINPTNQRVATILAYIRFSSNELSAAIDEANRALELNPNSMFMLDGLAYILILSGEWEKGVEYAHQVLKLNPYHRAILRDGLWVNYLRLEQYDLAYKESLHRRRPQQFWDPLIKASTLGLLGRRQEGQKYAEKLLELRPDFNSKGNELIQKFIKFDMIANRISYGLQQVGVKVG